MRKSWCGPHPRLRRQRHRTQTFALAFPVAACIRRLRSLSILLLFSSPPPPSPSRFAPLFYPLSFLVARSVPLLPCLFGRFLPLPCPSPFRRALVADRACACALQSSMLVSVLHFIAEKSMIGATARTHARTCTQHAAVPSPPPLYLPMLVVLRPAPARMHTPTPVTSTLLRYYHHCVGPC